MKCAQAFRAHVLDQFEPQDHPNDFAYPGAPPTPPYDMAGWTLAFSMGVKFDRVLEGFDGPFEELKEVVAPPAGGTVGRVDQELAGFYLDTRTNDAFRAVNELLAAGESVGRLQAEFVEGGTHHPTGTFFVKSKGGIMGKLTRVGQELGVTFEGSDDGAGEGDGDA